MLDKTLNMGVTGSPITFHAPATMTPEARLAEIGRILAAGYRRLVQFRESDGNPLDDLAAESAHGSTPESDKEAA